MEKTIEAVERVRKLDLLCEECYVNTGGGWGGQAMTPWECKKCKGQHVAGSTAHNSVCKDCALRYGICQSCGLNNHMYQK